MLLIKVLWVSFFVINIDCHKNKNQDKEDVFVATREWQVVKKGQSIPKGLHVRVNFETGVTEAKLLDKDDQIDTNNALLEIPQEKNNEEILKPEDIKEMLKNLKGDDILKVDEIKKINEKFRSYDELKKEMNDLNLTPKIDAEVLKDLFQQFEDEMKKDKVDDHSILRILEDFDFLAHQFDNALEFVRQNGFKEIIYKNLNISSNQVKQETLKLFGSLVQNNGKVQIHALETGSIGILLRILHLEQSIDVKSRAIFALSCLLRRFPLAQLKFVENGGISIITKILEDDPALKVQIKLVTLLNDLLLENIHALNDNANENQNMIIAQYKRVNLENLLLKQGWCEHLNKLLHLLIASDPEDHDSIEKCVLAMHNVANKCMGQYNSDILVSLKQRYKSLALNDLGRSDEYSNSDFFTNLHNLFKEMVHQNNIKTEL